MVAHVTNKANDCAVGYKEAWLFVFDTFTEG